MAERKQMCAADWDQRYRDTPEKWLTPDPLFIAAYDEFVAPSFPSGGKALDLAGGMGRHALYLAERGWDATILDISSVALDKAHELAAKRDLHLSTKHRDFAHGHSLAVAAYDLVLVFYFLDRALFPAIAGALKPNGILLYITYTLDQVKLGKGPSDPEHLLHTGELRRAFPGLTVLQYRETVVEKAIAELVARRESI